MKRSFFIFLLLLATNTFYLQAQQNAWIRINQLGYPMHSSKIAVWCSKQKLPLTEFELVDADTKKTVYQNACGKSFGAYGPFTETYRLNFSSFTKAGNYFLRTGNTQSPVFAISDTVYKGTADFCLRYMRQQRSGFNPFLKDSCHTHDGYTLYGPMPDSTHIDVTGGWHDASDYLQYSTTSANATYHLLAAYRDFPKVFTDSKQANGLEGKNGVADVLDEANWGLQWLMKMNPKPDLMFNQLGDDRDHMGMRIPKEDSSYGKGFERPVYFNSGKPQVRGKYMNATTGTASTAGKFSSAFSLASETYRAFDTAYANLLRHKAREALNFADRKPGVSQTASVRSPYIYAEDNWVDDMELAQASYYHLNRLISSESYPQSAYNYAKQEPITPWLGADTAKHYQWYPFINLGHYELAKQLSDAKRDTVIGYYREGIERVWPKARQNAFYRGIPFIWCSNNLTAAFAMQCYWYRQLTGDKEFEELEQSNIDWLFGCNPWGTSMVYGLPAWGDTPVDPHSAFTHLKNYPIDGGLVDGPVYTSIYKGLIGIQLKDADEYADFQSDLAVYHDDYGDYSSNEPTMDGTASLVYLLAAKENEAKLTHAKKEGRSTYPPVNTAHQFSHGAIVRGDSTKKGIALVFTGDEFGDGLSTITNTLDKQKVKGAFFFTGRFYRDTVFQPAIKKLYRQKHLMGPHSDMHLLYADWNKRDSLLVTNDSLFRDLRRNRKAMKDLGIKEAGTKRFFIPPYEWWNDEVSRWINSSATTLFSFTPGTASNADYTYPEMGTSYRSSDAILASIKKFNENRPGKLNGAILLIHAGSDPRRKDKLYNRLDELIGYLKKEGYKIKRIDELLH
jgi:peptidoglycan/xylan/chitin deacetylase (PgdA/CDA1 family)